MPDNLRQKPKEQGAQPLDLEEGPTKYLDRPTNDGKHGDAAEETPDSAPDVDTTRQPDGERAER
jgi:hypothetical protein